ncbi:putative oxidoreductase GLYR1 homolog [Trichonephila clavata]|uniref:Cytokine-like nuclear factor N-PAC n=1 Tax=Trichonephila clavata TaxID=2740835 RepID=A0A8X6FRM0_TRICU|nr:putative oxidoreductase GLYR1 homolog [Trichonephila clavata]
MKNFPFWPAKIVDPPIIKENTAKGLQKKKPSTPRKAQHYVFFFGSENHAWILDENIVPHSEEMLTKVTKKKSASYSKAIDEIVAASSSIVPKPIPVKEDSVKNKTTEQSSTVQNPVKITKTPSIKEDKLLKKSPTVQSVKRGRTPKQKIKSEKTKKSPQKRKLSEEASDKRRAKLSRMSDDFSALLSNDSPTNTYNPDAVVESLDNHSLVVEKYFKPPTESSSDVSSSSTAIEVEVTSKKIGFIGLGTMGQRNVALLLNSGHDVSVWNRTPEKCKQFVDAGAKQFSTISEVVWNCDVIFLCLSGPKASNSIVFEENGILQSLEKCQSGTKGFIEMTSIDPITSQTIAEAITQKGGKYLEAPINGLKTSEEDSPLILAAGDHDLFQSCLSCFQAMSKDSFYMSCDIGNSSKMNILLSMLMDTSYAAIIDGLTIIEKMNLSKDIFMEAVAFSARSCPLFADKGMSFIVDNFSNESSLERQRKILSMALDLGTLYSQPMSLTAVINERFKDKDFCPFQIETVNEDD